MLLDINWMLTKDTENEVTVPLWVWPIPVEFQYDQWKIHYIYFTPGDYHFAYFW